ncbi:protein spitz [Scaptodrosophila lebanonensis]|uniref:Protein spitz n=1 Tax=Drosophila lebanonensis TaxID=7225 RepID=A0A6J2TLC7_DROLE|nr:protein spitz [Scaptodrosophila lebanonensis]XP_030376849.1 protein spitz [Scaptodrosophila lebanonensis]
MHSTNRRTTVFYKQSNNMYQKLQMYTIAVLLGCLCSPTLACSSRTVPKARPSISSSMSGTLLPPTQAPSIISTTTTVRTTTTTPRPNITFPTYKCPETFDAWYCLNDAHCFAVKIGELPVYSCECATGFMGQRCEYKEIDGSYLPKRPRPMLEKASIASGAMCALVCMFIVCLALYLRIEQRAAKKAYELEVEQESESENCECCRAQCCGSMDEALVEPKLPYHIRLEHALMSFAIIRRTTKL